ncbi:hypothetical protein BX285_5224 [Streptomyces sp. 1114.5]|uniref:hypothetical protein n=1 Tax=Streptomyces sp. 1114.5 TaxID=1938830 RepID=UPI000EABD2E9|nr:hypothetical protein [Streptomyces sp. 1114.5]RKT11283.1 hypothetical protein BX285_5224 [Streptomyces sp. 1114.5]
MIRRLKKSLAAIAAVPVLVLGSASSASSAAADNAAVSWSTTDGSHNLCLAHDWIDAVTLEYVPTMVGTCLSHDSTTWRDDNSNLEKPPYSGNFYAEKTPGPDGKCLTAYGSAIYLEPCKSPVNWYEQWDEESIGGHWFLKNLMTNTCLAHPGFSGVAMKNCDARDSEQYWS